MRTIQIHLFKLEELSPEAQKNAFAQYVRKHEQWPCNWEQDIIKSKNAVLKAVGATQRHSDWFYCHEVCELRGEEAKGWLNRYTDWKKLSEDEGLGLTGFCFDIELSKTFIQSLSNGCWLWECINAVEFKAAQIQDEEKAEELSLPYFKKEAENRGMEFTENGVLFCETL